MSWFFIVALLISLIIAFYLGFRTINLFNSHQRSYFNTPNKKVFWIIIIVGSLSFIASQTFNFVLNGVVADYWLPLISSLTFSLMICFFYGIVTIDLFRFVRRFIFRKADSKGYVIQAVYIVLSLTLFITGLYLTSSPRIVNYHVNINKPAKVEKLRIVQLTDIHISEITSKRFIEKMVERVNALTPDYVFITGDTLDLNLKPYIEKNLADNFSQLQSTFGTFVILGNHEHYGVEHNGIERSDIEQNNTKQNVIEEHTVLMPDIPKQEGGNHLDDVVAAFKAGNMSVLLDDVFYDDRAGITLIGRDDYVVHQFNKQRMDLTSLVSLADKSKPIILLDHQPKDLVEPDELGIDIMFSGHTHAGQIFPMTLIVDAIYQNPWGIYQSGNDSHFTSIVSSGYGFWGLPLRLMTRSEIVVTNVHFATKSESKEENEIKQEREVRHLENTRNRAYKR